MRNIKHPELRNRVCKANRILAESGLVFHTFGNVSGIDRESGCVAIKPSGVPYAELVPEKMVLVDLEGSVLEGDLRPSSDTATHLRLYRGFESIGGVCHTHSKFATVWAQSGKPLQCFGTTHADYLFGPIPCTEPMKKDQIRGNYEDETGVQIVESFRNRDYQSIPAVLVAAHGPFSWGSDPEDAVFHSRVLEYIAELNSFTLLAGPETRSISQSLLKRHFFRKHGGGAYYGQPNSPDRRH